MTSGDRAPIGDVVRDEEVVQFRQSLPAFEMEQEIVDAVLDNAVTIITGGTGCGKSTQVPQFLLEAGFNYQSNLVIGVTQPRRVATTAVANRLRHELGNYGSSVSYQIRHEYDKCKTAPERIRVMTDGVLLKILESDILLRKFSVIVLDEIHERSLNCDLLLGLLSKVVVLREKLWTEKRIKTPPLKLVLMSATLNVSDFTTTLFPQAVHVHLRASMYPVICHFLKQTPKDYVKEAKKKVHQIHNKLPPGSILVFLTGRADIKHLMELLSSDKKVSHTDYELSQLDSEGEDEEKPEEAPADKDVCPVKHKRRKTGALICEPASVAPEVFELNDEHTSSKLVLSPDADEDVTTTRPPYKWLGGGPGSELKLIPLYAALSKEKQKEAFKEPRHNERIVIISTNIAETSLTLPNIRYIVDAGYAKERLYSRNGAFSNFERSLISKAAANQRSGRAGRLGEGHCYRLYSSAVYEHDMNEFPKIALNEQPLDSTFLYLANLGLPNLKYFPFPNSPPAVAVASAFNRLTHLQMVKSTGEDGSFKITEKGTQAVRYPIHPRFSAMLIRIIQFANNSGKVDVLRNGILGVCILAVGSELFTGEPKEKLPRRKPMVDDLDRLWMSTRKILRSDDSVETVCDILGVSVVRLKDALSLATQLLVIVAEENAGWQDQLSFPLAQRLLRDTSHSLEKLISFWKAMIATEDIRMVKWSMSIELLLEKCVAVKLSVIRPLSDQVLSRLSKADYRKYKAGYVTEQLGSNETALLQMADCPDLVVYTDVLQKGDDWYLRDCIEVDSPDKLDKIIKAAGLECPVLLQDYLKNLSRPS